MNKVSKFDIVSYEQFEKDMINAGYSINDALNAYKEIGKPKRSTTGSAGYDIVSPFGFTLVPGETILIPTGIRCKMNEDWVLMLFPRSSLGFKYQMRIVNTVPVIDSDYYNSDNEGHIMLKITTEKELRVEAGDKIVQGIFLPYGITEDDEVAAIRNGGIGSTGTK